jgi:hypothetical protein
MLCPYGQRILPCPYGQRILLCPTVNAFFVEYLFSWMSPSKVIVGKFRHPQTALEL